jgi:hypothetical protein
MAKKLIAFPWKHLLAENFCGFELYLYLQRCVNIADLTQLSVMVTYVDDRMVCFHILNRGLNERNLLCKLYLAWTRGLALKPLVDSKTRIYVLFTIPRKEQTK